LEETQIRPTGTGLFGNIYNLFKGKTKEAIEFLRQTKEGETVEALNHPEIGDVDLVWGNKKYGLEKYSERRR
jgi:hypothetical protein